MVTSKQREKSFREDFGKLLEKHNAEVEIAADNKMTIWMRSEYDMNANCLSEFTEFTLLSVEGKGK